MNKAYLKQLLSEKMKKEKEKLKKKRSEKTTGKCVIEKWNVH